MEPFVELAEEVLKALAAGAAGAALAATVADFLKKLQEDRSQQRTPREKPKRSDPTPPSSPTQTPLVKTSTVTTIPKQCLLLVISAAQEEFLKSLQAKGQIDMSDGERLYEITKYLWLGSETDFSESVREACIKQYSVSKGEESEYDICLVSIELNESSKGFEPNVNQLDRYDAFRNLAGLEINFKSRRLQMEAYGNFEVYNR